MQTPDLTIHESEPHSVVFDKIVPIESNGNTSECFSVQIDGKQFFMKRLKDEDSSNANYRYLFRKEFETGQQISHPNLAKYEGLHDDDNGYYILMEYICGKTLDEVISDDPQYFSRHDNADRFFAQLLSAIEALHSHNVVHSDIKPSNIMITQVNHNVKLIDLGFCFVDAYSRTTGSTPNFAAPEHNDISKIDVTTDIYCIGRLIEYIDSYSAKPLPKKYRSIMNKCLKPDKNDRFQQINEIAKKINSQKKRNIVFSVICAIILLTIATVLPYNPSSNDSIRNDTLTINFVKYSHFNDTAATCDIIGSDSTPNLYFEEKIKHNGNLYTVTQIADSAFVDRNYIVTIHFPNGIKEIGKSAFKNCKGLTAVNIPNSITEIGPYAFWGCDSIRNMKLSINLKEIPSACFAGFSCRSFSIPEGIEKINVDAFSQNGFLQSVTLPSTLKVLERGVFYNCHHLEEVTIPAGVEHIGEYLFFGCRKLKHIYNLSPTPQLILPIHCNPSQITLHVPAGSVEKYRKANIWKEMNIVAIK